MVSAPAPYYNVAPEGFNGLYLQTNRYPSAVLEVFENGGTGTKLREHRYNMFNNNNIVIIIIYRHHCSGVWSRASGRSVIKFWARKRNYWERNVVEIRRSGHRTPDRNRFPFYRWIIVCFIELDVRRKATRLAFSGTAAAKRARQSRIRVEFLRTRRRIRAEDYAERRVSYVQCEYTGLRFRKPEISELKVPTLCPRTNVKSCSSEPFHPGNPHRLSKMTCARATIRRVRLG